MAQMTNDELAWFIQRNGLGGTSIQTGPNEGYVVEYGNRMIGQPSGLGHSDMGGPTWNGMGLISDGIGHWFYDSGGNMTPVPDNVSQWLTATGGIPGSPENELSAGDQYIKNATYVPDWNQALKQADNGGFLADYGWMLPLAIAGGGAFDMGLFSGAGAGAGTAADSGLYGLELGGEGVGQAAASMTGGSAGYNAGAVLDAATQAAASGAGSAASLIPGFTNAQLVSGGMSLIGGLLSGNAAQDAADTSANAQLEAARIAAEAAKFKPVGVSTRFGDANWVRDAQGNVTRVDYSLKPDIKAQQDALISGANQMLPQYAGSLRATAPMSDAAGRMMSLGNQYLATDPQAQAAKYLSEQQALLAPYREREQTALENRLLSQGRLGLATGGTSTLGAANPEMEALRNARAMQDLQLAAQATQGGMDYAKFGSGMVGSGGDMLKNMYGTQAASLQPWQAGMSAAQYLEGLGQQPVTMGADLSKQTSNAAAGSLLAQGMLGAAQTQQAAAYSPWGTMLMNAGNAMQGMMRPTAQQPQQVVQPTMVSVAQDPYYGFFPSAGTQMMPSEWNWGGTWV